MPTPETRPVPFLPALLAGVLLAGCATTGWPEYRAAMKCHLEAKAEACDEQYEKALKANPKLPGLRASYASHLHRRGQSDLAEKHFQAEMEQHPGSRKAVKVVLEK